jgi:hypothetical protein
MKNKCVCHVERSEAALYAITYSVTSSFWILRRIAPQNDSHTVFEIASNKYIHIINIKIGD